MGLRRCDVDDVGQFDALDRSAYAHGVMLDPEDHDSDTVWTLVDISDKHRTQMALASERLRLKTVLERFPGGVLMEDQDGSITSVNRGLCELLDIPGAPDALIGLSLAPGLGMHRREKPAPIYWADGIAGAHSGDLRFAGNALEWVAT